MDDNKSVKIIFIAICLACSVPIYMLLGSTIEAKKKNALENAHQNWAPNAYLDCAWRYSISQRGDKCLEMYATFIKVWGGDRVNEVMFPERFEDVEDNEDEEGHIFNPPLVNRETPHKRTPEVLLYYAEGFERAKRTREAAEFVELALDADLFPVLSAWVKEKALRMQGRLKTGSF